MSDIKLDVYLYFRGNCREAMEFYKHVFGGELKLQTYGDVPDSGIPGGVTEANRDRIMHASLSGGDINLLASDTDKASDKAAKIDLTLVGKNEERMREIFSKLSEGGEVHQELAKMFWGDTFGSLTDKFNINWQVNIDANI